MAMLFDRCKDSVTSVVRGKKKRMEKANAFLDPWRTAKKTPPTMEKIMAGEGIADDTGFQRIAMQRDRWVAAKHAQQQAKALRTQADTVPADAPLMERLVVFAKLHPIATAAVAVLAVMVGPRKLMRYGGLALPLISKLKR